MERENESDSKDNSKEKPGALILAELRAQPTGLWRFF